MNCPRCEKEIVPDVFFCMWCEEFLSAPLRGKRATLFARWIAAIIDPLIIIIVTFVVIMMCRHSIAVPDEVARIAAALIPLCVIGFFRLLSQGFTPGKWLLGLQVVDCHRGEPPGFFTMFMREIFGKYVSGMFLGMGWFWVLIR